MNDATMSDAAGDQDNKIAIVVAISGTTKEEATRALNENGGNVEEAVSQIDGKKQAHKKNAELAVKSMKRSSRLRQPDDADDAIAKPFAARVVSIKQPEYSPSTEYTNTRSTKCKSGFPMAVPILIIMLSFSHFSSFFDFTKPRAQVTRKLARSSPISQTQQPLGDRRWV